MTKEKQYCYEILYSEIDEEVEMDILDYLHSEIGIEDENLFNFLNKTTFVNTLNLIREYEEEWNPSSRIYEDIKEQFLDFITVNLENLSNGFFSDLHHGYLYKFQNLVNGKVYIGQTKSLKTRIKKHRNSVNYTYYNNAFYNALRKHGIESFNFSVLDFADTDDELYEKERYYISLYRSFTKIRNSKGYNQTIGGEGTAGVSSVLSEKRVREIKKMIRDTDLSITQIATKFNVGYSTVYAIYWGNHWTHVRVEGFIPRMKRPDTTCKGDKFPLSTISDSIAVKIKELLRDTTLSQKEIAIKVGCREHIVAHIYKGNAWTHIVVDGFTPKMDRPNKEFKTNKRVLTQIDVRKIKKLLIKGEKTHSEIAEFFNVKRETITKISREGSWKHVKVDGFIPSGGDGILKGEKVKTAKLNEKLVREIKTLLIKGENSMRQIAMKYGVNPESIRKIKNDQMWKEVRI
jgi:group I intron endonuclease